MNIRVERIEKTTQCKVFIGVDPADDGIFGEIKFLSEDSGRTFAYQTTSYPYGPETYYIEGKEYKISGLDRKRLTFLIIYLQTNNYNYAESNIIGDDNKFFVGTGMKVYPKNLWVGEEER